MLIYGCPGNLIGDEYSEKLDDFKKEFGRAKESFDRSMQVEVLKAIHGIGALFSDDCGGELLCLRTCSQSGVRN